MKFADKLVNLSPYDPTMDQYPVKLDANESPYPWRADLLAPILAKLADKPLNRYPDPACRALRSTAGKLYGVDADNIVCGNGSDELISVITNSFNEKGAKILVALPDFSMYGFYAHIAECELVTLSKNDALTFCPDDLIAAAKANDVNMVIFSNPCNPTGQGISREAVLHICRSLSDTLVIVDEAYMDFWDQSIIPDLDTLDNVIVLKTCSKAFGLAGIRLGFALTSKEIAGYINRARSPFNMNTLTQELAAELLSDPIALRSASAMLTASRLELAALLRPVAAKYTDKIRIIDTVTNFVLLECDNAPKYLEALKTMGVCVRLQMKKYLRITAGSPAENTAVVAALDKVLADN